MWQSFVMVGIGDRVAAYRRRRGLSQVALAGLVGRSESWLSQVERGRRGVDSLTVVRDLAIALGTTPDTLTGIDLPVSSAEASHHATVALRRYVDGCSQLLTAPQTPTATAGQLQAEVEALNTTYQGARYAEALAACPQLLAAVDALLRVDDGPDTVHVYVGAYVVTAKILHKIGESRLAALAADRAAAMAARLGASGRDRGLAAREVVGALLAAGQVLAAEALAANMAAVLEADPDADTPDLVSLRGSLLLLAAVIAARRTERFLALERLRAAEQLAAELGYDGNHCWTAFGPTNVAIHAVSVAAELGDAGEAVRLSHRVDPDHLPVELVSRRAQLHVDLAWAYTQHRRDADALVQLLECEQVAPQLIQFHSVVREAVADLVGRSRTSTGVLHDLAVRAGVLT